LVLQDSEVLQDVTLAALYVSTKMHDTLKKPRELLMVSYAVRFPELMAKSKSLGGEIDMDPAVSLVLVVIFGTRVLTLLLYRR
jgi:hypothetical protein